MRNNLLLAFVLVLPASSSRAAVVAPSAVSGRVWVAPVAGLFSAVGTERIATLGSPSLTALSALDASARYPFADAPQVLDLLAKNLKFYATPEGFASLPAEDKLIALRAAAKGAEIEAAAIADAALAEAKSRALHPSNMDAVAKQVAQADAVALYLDAPRREETARIRSKVERFTAKWRKHVEKFHEDLPIKIAAGVFDAGNVLVKTEHGWVAADESPYPIEADLSKFYERRTEAMKRMPQGQWTISEASLLSSALDRPEIGGEKSWSAPARLKLADVIASARQTIRDDRSLAGAVAAFERSARDGRPVAPRHILAVEKYYKEALNPAPLMGSIRFRILAAIRNGAGGLPSWEAFQEASRATYARTRRTAVIAAGVLVAGLIALFPLSLTGLAAWPAAAKFAVLMPAWLAPMIVFVRNLWVSQNLETARDFSSVDERLRRTFPND